MRTSTQHPISRFISYHKLRLKFSDFIANISTLEVPSNFQVAQKEKKWKEAIREEPKVLYKNQTWEVVMGGSREIQRQEKCLL